MKKKLDTSFMENELENGSAFFRKPFEPTNDPKEEIEPSPLPLPSAALETEAEKRDQPEMEFNQPVNQSIDPSANQSIDQSTDQSTKQLIGKVTNRPVAFYIPETINKKIDDAVQYYKDKHRKRIDRSAIVSAILGDPNLWTDQSLDRLTNQVTDQLVNRLTSRSID